MPRALATRARASRLPSYPVLRMPQLKSAQWTMLDTQGQAACSHGPLRATFRDRASLSPSRNPHPALFSVRSLHHPHLLTCGIMIWHALTPGPRHVRSSRHPRLCIRARSRRVFFPLSPSIASSRVAKASPFTAVSSSNAGGPYPVAARAPNSQRA